MIDVPDALEYGLTLVLLVVSVAIFGYLAVRSRSVRSFQFQISVFVLIWMLGEIVNVLLQQGIVVLPGALQELGYEIHLSSMVFFGAFLYTRYYYSRRRGKRLVENVEVEGYDPEIERRRRIQGEGEGEGGEEEEPSPSEKKS
jgi:bacteriorhodopsin